MDWPAFFSSLGGFIERMLGIGWWMVLLLAVLAILWKHGFPWKKGE